MNRQYQKTLTFRLKGTLCICKSTMQIIPFHFLCVRDWFHRGVLCNISSVYDHTPTSLLRLKIAVGGTRHSGWKKRYWPCAIIRGADTHCWQSLEHGLGVTITLALLSRIRTIPVKPAITETVNIFSYLPLQLLQIIAPSCQTRDQIHEVYWECAGANLIKAKATLTTWSWKSDVVTTEFLRMFIGKGSVDPNSWDQQGLLLIKTLEIKNSF